MVDLGTAGLLVCSAFFAVLSLGLLVRYRQVSTQISSSNDLGHDLWEALEERMRKQDERILGMMGRFEVVESRVVAERVSSGGGRGETIRLPSFLRIGDKTGGDGASQMPTEKSQVVLRREGLSEGDQELVKYLNTRLTKQDEQLVGVMNRLEIVQSRLLGRGPVGTPSMPTTPRLSPQIQPRAANVKVDEEALITMMAEGPRTSVEIRERFGITREHAARVLKGLFDRQLVVRNDTHKPFVYELTEAGRKLLAL